MLILCGSSMSFIEEQLLGSTTPLFGRTSAIIKLLPLSFSDASRFFERYSLRDTIASYAILGGIPHYLKQFDDGQPLRANIEQRILQRFSPLYNEAEFMLKQSLREVATNNSCGIHIHLDGEDHTPRSIRNFLNIIYARNDLFYKALGIEAQRARYCKKIDGHLVSAMNRKKPTTFGAIEEIGRAHV